jgi:hypothetical protein
MRRSTLLSLSFSKAFLIRVILAAKNSKLDVFCSHTIISVVQLNTLYKYGLKLLKPKIEIESRIGREGMYEIDFTGWLCSFAQPFLNTLAYCSTCLYYKSFTTVNYDRKLCFSLEHNLGS